MSTRLLELLKDRQGPLSIEAFANKMDLRAATLSRQYAGKRNIGVPALHKYAAHFRDDTEMIEALAEYALGFPYPKAN